MVLILYGNTMSTYTQRVLIVLKETNTPHQFVTIDLSRGEQKDPIHMAKNPFGLVPFILRACFLSILPNALTYLP
jgi:glutathione S-transferase